MVCLAARPAALHAPCWLRFLFAEVGELLGAPQKELRSRGSGTVASTKTGFIIFSSIPCLNLPAVNLKETEENVSVCAGTYQQALLEE